MRVPNMAHSPTVPHRLLAPQYLKKIERLEREQDGTIFQLAEKKTGLTIDKTHSILVYGHGMHVKTIHHLPGASVPAMHVNVGTAHYKNTILPLMQS